MGKDNDNVIYLHLEARFRPDEGDHLGSSEAIRLNEIERLLYTSVKQLRGARLIMNTPEMKDRVDEINGSLENLVHDICYRKDDTF